MLKWGLEKFNFYRKTNFFEYITKNGFWILVGKGTSFLASLGIMLVFANLIPKETYGSYKYVLSFFAMASIFALPGMGSIITRSFSQGKESVLFLIEKEKFRWGSVGTLFLVSIGGWYICKANYLLGVSFMIGGVFLPFEQIFRMFTNIWQGRMNFKKQGLYESAGFLFPALAIATTLFFTSNLILIILSYFLSYGLVRGVLYLISRKTVERDPSDKHSEDIAFGKHLTVIQIISKVAEQIDKVILWHISGPLAVATLSFAQMPISQIEEFFPIQALALPKLSTLSTDDAKRKIKQKFFVLFLFFVPITLAIIILAPIVFDVLFPIYNESVPYFQLLSLGILLLPFTLLSTHFVSHTNTRALYTVRTIAPLAKITLYLALVPIWGILGIVYATLIGQVLDAGLVYYFFSKTTN